MDNGESVVAVPATGVFLNASDNQLSDLFSDHADDGEVNGTSLGYDITSITETVPLINADQIVIQFAAPVSLSDLGWELTGVAGTQGLGVPATIPGIADSGPVLGPNNTVIVPLEWPAASLRS